MRVAKISPETLEHIREFKNYCEYFLEKEQFSFKEPSENWKYLDDDDEDKVFIMYARDQIAIDMEIRKEDVDTRILAYECLLRKYSNRLGHLLMTAEVLLDNCCDPQKTYLNFSPYLETLHVAPEQ